MNSTVLGVLFLFLAACSSSRPQAGIQAAPPAPNAEQSLSDLIAKTNALRGFTARYGVTSSTDLNGTLTLAYSAPDRGAFLIDSKEGRMRQWVVGSRITRSSEGPDGHEFASSDFQPHFEELASLGELLQSEFPTEPEPRKPERAPGVFFEWSWKVPSGRMDSRQQTSGEALRIELNLQVGFRADREDLLGWLTRMQRGGDPPIETDDAWSWNLPNGSEVSISKSSGFITRMMLQKPDGTRVEIELQELDLAAPPEEWLAPPQSPPPGSRLQTAEMEAGMRWTLCFSARNQIWKGFQRRVDDGRLIWNEESAQKVARVFQDLQSHFARLRAESWTPDLRAWIDERVAEAASRTDDVGRTRLNETRERAIEAMNEKFDEQFRSLLSMEAPDSVPEEFAWKEEILQCERRAACAEYERQFRGPMLAYLNERFDAALAR